MNFLESKNIVNMAMWGYLRFRIYFFATKAEKRIMRGGVLIRRIVGSTGGVLDRNSVSFCESRKTSWTTLVYSFFRIQDLEKQVENMKREKTSMSAKLEVRLLEGTPGSRPRSLTTGNGSFAWSLLDLLWTKISGVAGVSHSSHIRGFVAQPWPFRIQ